MSKVAHYLQEHLVGEIMTGTDARRYFATDGSILQLAPALIVYPRNENDVRKTARFSWQLAERGRVIPITPRGAGTDRTGAALGSGIMLVFPAHMNRIVDLDNKSGVVTVEPGINFGKLEQALHTHGRFLPPYPPSAEYSTVGGSLANNASGEKSVKYGDMAAYAQSLRVVLANGEVIETSRLNKRDLSKKLGLATFEGEIYRSLDALIEENHELIQSLARGVTKNNAGYNLIDVKQKNGSFDLTPLFAGSQGTLGIITEATFDTEPYNPETALIMAQFDSLEQAQTAILELRSLKELPSSIELVDGITLQAIHDLNPNQLKEVVQPPFPAVSLLVEFDDDKRHIKKTAKRAERILESLASTFTSTFNVDEKQQLAKLRQAVSSWIGYNEGQARPLPLVDGAVPVDRLREYMDGVYGLLEANSIKTGLWGHAGDGHLTLRPRLNIGMVGDRQKAFRFLDAYHKLVIDMGGTITFEAGDGRLRTPYLEAMYGPEAYNLLKKVKNIFDPYDMLNPGVKFGTSMDDVKAIVRSDFGLDHLYDHMPRA
jgi:FAD/FMN-containing dehydrogenase